MMDENWRKHAACRDANPRLFDPLDDVEVRRQGPHPTAHARIQQAISVCSLCPVQRECGQQADVLRAIGVWAATYRKQAGAAKSSGTRPRRVRKAAA